MRKHLDDDVEVRCCLSKEKCLHASAGDILIDDWEKYRSLWEESGGIWITHRSASETVRALKGLKGRSVPAAPREVIEPDLMDVLRRSVAAEAAGQRHGSSQIIPKRQPHGRHFIRQNGDAA